MVAPALASAADPTDPGYQRNAKEHTELVAQLRSRLADTALGGPEKVAHSGMWNEASCCRANRVDSLLDPGSPFLELSPVGRQRHVRRPGPGRRHHHRRRAGRGSRSA